MAYSNAQQDAIWGEMLERSKIAFLDHKRAGKPARGYSHERRVRVTRTELAKFEAHCAERAAKNAALRALRVAR